MFSSVTSCIELLKLAFLPLGRLIVNSKPSIGIPVSTTWVPSAFNFSTIPFPSEFHKLQSKLFYFSFVTLTSIGYGDIMPVNPAAQTVAILEGLIGQLFPAILLARLVSLEIESRQSREQEKSDE